MTIGVELIVAWLRLERAKYEKEARLVIWHSADGETDWKPVLPKDVPEWLKKPRVVKRLVDGEMAHEPTLGAGWYRAERVDSVVAVPEAANEPLKVDAE